MKVLVFGNSNDTGGWVKDGSRRTQDLLRGKFAAEFGEPVEVIAKNSWPNDRLPSFVERCLDEVDPDLVYINITTYPFSYESTPLRVKRLLGKLGEPVGDAGMRLAESKRWAYNPVFRTLRGWGQATIGGDTHFTPEEVAARYAEAIRVCARREGSVLVVKGPLARGKKGTRRERERQERRRAIVHRAVKSLCEQLHVHYVGSDEPYWKVKPAPKGSKAGDGLHSNELGHAFLADDHFGYLREAWATHLATLGEQEPARV